MQSVRNAAANIRKTGGFVQYLAIAAYSLNEMKGRVGAGRTRARYATRFLQPTLLRASPETPSCFALRLSQEKHRQCDCLGFRIYFADLHSPGRVRPTKITIGAQTGPQLLSHLSQQRISHGMPIAVIHRFEIIQIQ